MYVRMYHYIYLRRYLYRYIVDMFNWCACDKVMDDPTISDTVVDDMEVESKVMDNLLINKSTDDSAVDGKVVDVIQRSVASLLFNPAIGPKTRLILIRKLAARP